MSDPVKTIVRRGRKILVVDFTYVDERGRRQRYRRDAQAATKTGAREEARRLMDRAARTGSPFVKQPAKATCLGAFVDAVYRPHFLPSKRPGTQERYESVLELHVLPFFGDTPLDDIDGMSVRRFDTYLRDKGITSPRQYVSVLRAVLRAAVHAGELAEMPRNLPTYRQSKKIPECPTAEDVRLLLEHCGESWLRVAVALMAYAGLRVSEARALEVRDVDLEKATLYVRRNYSGDKNGGVKLDTTKDSEHRPVPINGLLQPFLVAAVRSKLPTAPLLLTGDGNVPRRQHVTDRLKRTQRRNGLRVHGPHQLRHYFTTALLDVAHPDAVMQLTGHADLKTLARYAHATRQDLVDAVAKLT